MIWKDNLDWIREHNSLEQFNKHFNTTYTLKRYNAMCKYHNIPTIKSKRFWTKEQLDWLQKNAGNDRKNLLKSFNKKFNKNIKMNSLKDAIRRYGLTIPSSRIAWTQDKFDWLQSQSYDDRDDLLKAFKEHYNVELSSSQFAHINYLYKLNIPPARKRMEKFYSSRSIPYGSDSAPKGDRAQVKIDAGVYVAKHRFIYEQYHNITLEQNECIIFLDGDNTNFDIDNLYKIPMSLHVSMSTNGYYKLDRLPVIKALEWKQLLKEVQHGLD